MTYKLTTSFSLGEVAEYLGASLVGDPSRKITGICTLSSSSEEQITFLANPSYFKELKLTKAGAVIIAPKYQAYCPVSALLMEDPYWGYARVSQLFKHDELEPGVHSGAFIGEGANVPATASIAPGTVIEAGVTIGENVVIGPGCVVRKNVQLGDCCLLHANVTIYPNVRVGSNSTIHSGAVIGADGFGYAPHQGKWEKIVQHGTVKVGSGVEIGANTTVDRGAIEDTIIGDGVIIDNQVQIAHNVTIGEGTAIAACSAIAGSTRVGRYCTIAGAVAIAGHLTIADRVHIAAMSMVSKDIKHSGSYASGAGSVTDIRLWRKNAVRFRQLNELSQRVSGLEKLLRLIRKN